MDGKMKRIKSKRDLVKLLQCRELNGDVAKILKQHTQFTDSLVKRLGLEIDLQAHQGCVNCLQWTPDGKFLASGSDDTKVILWDPFRHKKLQVIHTHHFGNIFSVKFLGSNNMVATAAGDCKVFVQTLHGAALKNPPILECSCHLNRVKRLANSPEEPTLFWSAGEDGLVIQYDLREQHTCFTNNVLISMGQLFEAKCIAVNPTQPQYIALGGNDCYIRMFDRRMIKLSKTPQVNLTENEERPIEPKDPNCVQFYSPGHLAVQHSINPTFKLSATYVAFNSAGSELLVNLGGEQIYLFDVNNSRHINELQIPQCLNKTSTFTTNGDTKNNCIYDTDDYALSSYMAHSTIDDDCPCFYMRRAFRCFERRWMGDLYSAARDYFFVTKRWPDHKKAYIGLVNSLIALKWTEEARRWLDYYCKNHPELSDSFEVRDLNKDIEELQKASDDKEEFTSPNEKEIKLRLDSRDYELRFLGHCNTTTDIKEANFLGEDGNYICAGSDEGVIFIWERKRSTIVTALYGDLSIVNCIQPHPSACLIASSGIDSGVKLWSPMKEDDTINEHVVKDINTVVEANQQRLSMDPFESMLVNMGYYRGYGGFSDAPTCRTC